MPVHILYGKITKGQPIFDSGFASEVLSTNQTSNVSNSAFNYVSITAYPGAAYVAFSNTGSPDANTNPRAYIPGNTAVEFAISTNTRISVV